MTAKDCPKACSHSDGFQSVEFTLVLNGLSKLINKLKKRFLKRSNMKHSCNRSHQPRAQKYRWNAKSREACMHFGPCTTHFFRNSGSSGLLTTLSGVELNSIVYQNYSKQLFKPNVDRLLGARDQAISRGVCVLNWLKSLFGINPWLDFVGRNWLFDDSSDHIIC